MTEEDRRVLEAALDEIKSELTHERRTCSFQCQPFSDELIEDVVDTASKIFSVGDVLQYCPVYSVTDALQVLEIVQDVFLDIPDFDEAVQLVIPSFHSISPPFSQVC